MTIGIVGIGYVGLPLAMAFAEAGHDVIGVDVEFGRVKELRAGRSHVEDIADEELQAAMDVTAHPDVDHGEVARRAALTLDLRGVTGGVGAANVLRL